MNKIPVFYHIPKCGGTYLFNIMRGWCDRQEKIDNISIKTISIKKESTISYRLYSTFDGDSKDIICKLSEYVQSKKTSDKIFFAIVEPNGNWTNFIQDLSLQSYDLSHFVILREPFNRIRSLFNYLNKDESIHEKTHHSISKDFKTFLESEEYEDSFVIRKFVDITESESINQSHYEKVLQYFDQINMNVGDMKDIVEVLNKTLCSCGMQSLNIDRMKINNPYFVQNQKTIKNETEYFDNRDLEDFSQQTIDFFTERTKYDRMLYDNYANIT
jgi:hypothetical protein